MKLSKSVFLVFAFGLAGVVLSGCPLLMIGSLGYSGYQYHEKEGVFAPGQALGGAAPDNKNDTGGKSSSSASKPPPPADNSIE
jgi:hypothetical protein